MSFVKRVTEWLDKSNLRPLELLGYLAAMNETFMVDGDSLILETIQHEIVDWSGSSGQYLQVAYLVESFLNDLKERGASFQLVFFNLTQVALSRALPSSRGNKASPQSLLLLRTAVLDHLITNTDLPVKVYDDWNCADFETFLNTVHPSFMLCSPCITNSVAEITSEHGIPIELVQAMKSLKVFSKSVAIAYLSELQFKDRQILAESVLPFNMAEHNELNTQAEKQLLPHLHRVYNSIVGSEVFTFTLDASFSEVNTDSLVAEPLVVAKQILSQSHKSSIEFSLSELVKSSSFDWRYIIASLASQHYLKSSTKKEEANAIVQAYLIQTVLANHMAPQLRPRSKIAASASQSPAYHAAIDEFTIYIARVANVAASTASFDVRTPVWDVIDIVDSRMVLSILAIISQDGIASTKDLGFSDNMVAELEFLWKVANAGAAGSIAPLSASSFKVAISDAQPSTTLATTNLIPVRSTMVDRMIQGEDKPELKESDYVKWEEDKKKDREQIAAYPWKTSRALDYAHLLYYDQEFAERKLHLNRFQAHWAKLAQSLEARPTQNAVLQPKVIMAKELSPQEVLEQLKAKLELESKPKTALNDTREKEQARVKSLTTAWRGSPIPKRISTLAAFIPTTVAATFDWLYALLDVHIEQYRILKNEKENASRSTASPDSIQFVQQRLKALQRDEIFDQCVSMIVQCGVGMLEYQGTSMLDPQSAIMRRLMEIFDSLGLTSIHTPPDASSTTATLENGTSYPAGEDSLSSAARFQLSRMGPWMRRDVGAVPDPRASRLLDSWQIDVLDCIDSYKSCLVVAPTSAGKSFMGFHAMSRVLETEDSVLVYVAPTKALVNQVVAEVYSKFSKVNVPPGTLICGTFTRDMRIAPVNSRIVVTTPQCLEVLLLSRELAVPGGWRSKLRWVIFDEVHCIGMDDGALWERLLPLVPCPFLALSATVGDVENFQGWLRSLATAKSKYAAERPSLVVVPKTKEDVPAVSTATAKATKAIHPKLAAKAAKQQHGGGKGKNKKEAKASAASAESSDANSSTSSIVADGEASIPFPGFVKEPFRFINHPHRYSDLYKYIMIPRFFVDGQQFTGTSPKPETVAQTQILSELRAMHPWTGLHTWHFQSESPPSSSFSPKECLQVYQSMAKYAHLATQTPAQVNLTKPFSSQLASSLLTLKPEHFFTEGTIIDQRMMRAYEKLIKSTFIVWSKDNEELAELVLKDLTGDMFVEIEEATQAGIPLGKDLGSENFLTESLPSFIEVLREQQWLPAIAFNFDPAVCERLAISLNNALIEKETSYKQSSEYRNARLKFHEEMKEWEAELKRKERASKKKKDKRNDEDLDKDGDPTMDMPVDPDYELAEGTTFTRDGEVELLDDLKAEAQALKNRGVNGLLVDAIRRGIGVHHNGLDTKYRQAVERHFRTGQIKIVFATETLALGINMPCRSTIFAGDSPNLTPLQYRQMSGRAGRRGYDPLGRVIFWGIPMHRITFLEGAKLAPIRGQFPLSLSFNLRGLVLGTADIAGTKKKRQQEVEDAAAESAVQPGAKKAAAKKAAAAAAKKAAAAAAAPKVVKDSWDDSDDSEDEDDEPVIKRKAPAKASWDDSSDEETEDKPVAAAAEPEPEVDEVMVPAGNTEMPTGATEIFESIQQVFTHSLYLHQHSDAAKSQLDIHTQCSLQYMAKLGLITPLGKPIDLAGLTCHLGWAEPANILLSKFFASDIISEICATNDLEGLLLLTAHLFGRVSVPNHTAAAFREQLAARTDQPKHSALHHCNHQLFLPALPAHQQKIIDDHNRECLEILNTVILPYAKTHKPYSSESSTEQWLHRSKLPHLSQNSAEQPQGGLFQKLADSKLEVIARSPLAALGGSGDLFTTQADLRTMRHGLAAADFGMLVNEDAHGNTLPLNGFLYDLFINANYEWLIKYNMFNDSDLFANCADYLENLKAIKDALLHRSRDPKTDRIYRTFSKLIREFEAKHREVFRFKIRRKLVWVIVRGVDGYNGDLQKHILSKTRISVLKVRKVPTGKPHQYFFRVPCRNDSDKTRLVELFSQWSNPEWWIDAGDNEESDDSD
jgi:superfamily II DNA or RNA helicase